MTLSPKPESPEPLKVVAYRYVPSDVWREVVLTEAPAKASLAKELGRTVDELVLKYDAEAAIQAARNEAEAMRAAIDAHNAECESMCEQRQQSGDAHCPFAKYGRQCPDCPRDGMLDIAMKGDAHA